MKYVFFGTPEFAAIILRILIAAGMPPCALLANPDLPKGRKKTISPPATKSLLIEKKMDIPIMQPARIDADTIAAIRELRPDFFIVAAYAKILPKILLDIPVLGSIGVHPSLLPKYRGTTPIQSAILDGAPETGTTLFLIDERIDHGPTIAQASIPIHGENYETLANRLAEISGALLVKHLPLFRGGALTPLVQDETQATFTKKFTMEEAFVPFEDLEKARSGASGAEAVARKIRALNPEPGAYTVGKNGKRIKLLDCLLEKNVLVLTKIQYEGKLPIERNISLLA